MIQLSGQNGGGQILRSALTLSMVTGQPFRLTEIRGKRPKPGLMRQHLTCVKAAVEISQGAVDGDELGSTEIVFHPGKVTGGDYRFAIGTAGSTTLLAQTLLPALWRAAKPSSLILEGGTHNPMAPPMDFLQRVYLPALQKMGLEIEVELLRFGFVPAGGGKIQFSMPGQQALKPIELMSRGEELERRIHCLSAHLDSSIGKKESQGVRKKLGWPENTVHLEETDLSDCAGNILSVEMRFEQVTERVCSFGAVGKSSERVASEVSKLINNYLNSGAVVGRCLADQLLLPMALAGGGKMLTMSLSNHVKTNREVIEAFLPVTITDHSLDNGLYEILITAE